MWPKYFSLNIDYYQTKNKYAKGHITSCEPICYKLIIF